MTVVYNNLEAAVSIHNNSSITIESARRLAVETTDHKVRVDGGHHLPLPKILHLHSGMCDATAHTGRLHTHRQVDLLEKDEAARERSAFLEDGQRVVTRHIAGVDVYHKLAWLATRWHDDVFDAGATGLGVIKVDLERPRYGGLASWAVKMHVATLYYSRTDTKFGLYTGMHALRLSW